MSKRIAHKQKKSIVYMATNKVTSKRYVGITCRAISDRRSGHFYAALKGNSQTYFHRAIRKYGKEKFEFVVLEICETYDEAAKREIALIESIKPEYNQTKGGDGYLGWSPSEEQRHRISERLRGKPGPWKGKALAKSFEAGRRRWNHSDNGKKSWSECSKLGPQSIQRPVVCLNDGAGYASATAAASAYGVHASSVSAVCLRNSNRKTVGGLVFRFYGEHHGGITEANREKQTARNNQLRHIAQGRKCRVRCVDDGKIFDTVKDTAEFYGIGSGTVISACKKRGKYKTKNSERFAYVGANT